MNYRDCLTEQVSVYRNVHDHIHHSRSLVPEAEASTRFVKVYAILYRQPRPQEARYHRTNEEG